MMPRLEAEESLHMVDQIMIGTGSIKDTHKADARRIVNRWRETAQGRQKVKADPKMMGVLGIGVELVTKESTPVHG